ncbi:hypothetical protein AL542_07425 [Grimontia hollisae]|nr:hypothetical protein AL542_07425 [Grimontia hollisae]
MMALILCLKRQISRPENQFITLYCAMVVYNKAYLLLILPVIDIHWVWLKKIRTRSLTRTVLVQFMFTCGARLLRHTQVLLGSDGENTVTLVRFALGLPPLNV